MRSSKLFPAVLLPAIAIFQSGQALAGEARHLTLAEAVHLALRENRALKIARLHVVETEQKKAAERSGYFPGISNHSELLRVTDAQNIGLAAGALGVYPGVGPVPGENVRIPQGQQTFVVSGTTIAQPLTQLIRISKANRIAASEVDSSRIGLQKAETLVALKTHQLYYAILTATLQKRAAEQQIAYTSGHLRESQDDERNGSALHVDVVAARAGLLESRQALLSADLQLSDLNTEFDDVLGLPLDTQVELQPGVPDSFELESKEAYVRIAWAESPEIREAEQTVLRARAAVRIATSAYIPDITAFARHSYQNGVPFLVRNFGTFGLNFTWDVFDFGKRGAKVKEHEAQLAQAEENVRRLKDQAAVEIERIYNKIERTKRMVEVTTEVVRLRQEGERLASNRLAQNVSLVSERYQATAARYKAEAELLQAQSAYALACAELQQAIGRTPGL
jgi:outer membrane protein TolC